MDATPIEELVCRAGFDWHLIPPVFQDDLTADWESVLQPDGTSLVSDAVAVQRIGGLLSQIAPEAERGYGDEDEGAEF